MARLRELLKGHERICPKCNKKAQDAPALGVGTKTEPSMAIETPNVFVRFRSKGAVYHETAQAIKSLCGEKTEVRTRTVYIKHSGSMLAIKLGYCKELDSTLALLEPCKGLNCVIYHDYGTDGQTVYYEYKGKD